jgi:hypothetical protein
MLGKPTGSPSSGQSQSDPGGQEGERQRAGERQGAGERVGALTIARCVKDDGRALILYTRDRRPRT